jgi:DNA-binding MarR family transcriptional regulator
LTNSQAFYIIDPSTIDISIKYFKSGGELLASSGEHCIIDSLQNLYTLLNAKFGHCAGISPSRFRLLLQLYYTDEISQTSLQKELQIDSAAVTRHLKQLEADGIVERRMNPNDNRVTLVRLSNHGRQEIVSFQEEKARFMTQLLQDFSKEEQQQFSSMIQRMQTNIQDYKGEK